LARGELPMPKDAQAAVRDILEVDSGTNADGETWTVFAKTGWTNAPDPDVGWWVGWVEVERADGEPQILPFAVNIDIHSGDDAKKRVRRNTSVNAS
ncbi:MAG: penicillin-binding transpeptidase domain-containing protein, partial [Shimia sp.]